MNGYLAAAIAVVIWASYPVATRAAVTGSFSPNDLVALRFGIAALLFAPYLLLRWRRIGGAVWLKGLPLTLFHGAGMAALAVTAMQFAPATHAAALGPGASPAWVALLGFFVLGNRPSRRALAGALLCALGVALLMLWSATDITLQVLAGDTMFLAASALAALYLLHLRRWRIDPIEGAALVSLYSALVVVPYYLWTTPGSLARLATAELLWQSLWQGVLIGCVAVLALNRAVVTLGAQHSSTLVALVPVLTAILALVFLGEIPSMQEVAALITISAGVSLAAAPAWQSRREVLQPAVRAQSAPPVSYLSRDSAP